MSTTITKGYILNYMSIPTLSKNFWLFTRSLINKNFNQDLELLKLHITDGPIDILINNAITHKYFQTDKCEGDTFITSNLDLNGKINNKDIIIREKVDYKSYERTGNIYLKYELGCKINGKHTNKMLINNEYKIYRDEDTDIVNNFWYILPNTSADILEEINQLIYKNKDNIEILE